LPGPGGLDRHGPDDQHHHRADQRGHTAGGTAGGTATGASEVPTTEPADTGHFEPLTGDYLFLTWGAAMDRVYIVQGFMPPPPIPG